MRSTSTIIKVLHVAMQILTCSFCRTQFTRALSLAPSLSCYLTLCSQDKKCRSEYCGHAVYVRHRGLESVVVILKSTIQRKELCEYSRQLSVMSFLLVELPSRVRGRVEGPRVIQQTSTFGRLLRNLLNVNGVAL